MQKLPFDKFTIYEVEDMQKELLALLQSAEDEVVLDMGDVEKMDMAAIQLLIAASKSAKERSCRFRLANVAQPLLEALETCACDELLGVSHE